MCSSHVLWVKKWNSFLLYLFFPNIPHLESSNILTSHVNSLLVFTLHPVVPQTVSHSASLSILFLTIHSSHSRQDKSHLGTSISLHLKSGLLTVNQKVLYNLVPMCFFATILPHNFHLCLLSIRLRAWHLLSDCSTCTTVLPHLSRFCFSAFRF